MLPSSQAKDAIFFKGIFKDRVKKMNTMPAAADAMRTDSKYQPQVRVVRNTVAFPSVCLIVDIVFQSRRYHTIHERPTRVSEDTL